MQRMTIAAAMLGAVTASGCAGEVAIAVPEASEIPSAAAEAAEAANAAPEAAEVATVAPEAAEVATVAPEAAEAANAAPEAMAFEIAAPEATEGAIAMAEVANAAPVAMEFEIAVPEATEVERLRKVYSCGDRRIPVEYVNAGPVSLAVLTLDNMTVVASNVIAASGAKFAGAQYVWWTKGEQAALFDLTGGEDAAPVICTAGP